MAALAYLNSISSTLLRLAAYVFLEVVPARQGKFIIPALFGVYLVTYLLTPTEALARIKSTKTAELLLDKDVALNGEIEEKVRLIDVTEVVEEVPPPNTFTSALSTILLSLPTPFQNLRLTNLLINLLLLIATIDFLATPYVDDASDVVYTRVGAVYPTAAKVVVRYPQSNASDSVRIAYRQLSSGLGVASDFWSKGPTVNLTRERDWVSSVKLQGLFPNTQYEYKLEYVNDTTLPYPATPIRFHTFPDPRLAGVHFNFLATSCMTPNFPYAPFQSRRIKGFDILAEHIWPEQRTLPPTSSTPAAKSTAKEGDVSASLTEDYEPTPLATLAGAALEVPAEIPEEKAQTEFMIFMGDFIYADVPVYFGDDKEAYRRLYRRNYQSPSFRKVYERLPIFHTYDDHEIINNFAGEDNYTLAPFPNADDAFRLYNAEANFESPVEDQHWYNFRYGDVAFFVMDTRRHRSGLDLTDEASRTMLGEQQLTALYDWMSEVNNTATFKFIVTSVPFTSLWGHDAQTDSWAGFAYEKSALLNALHSVKNVVLLSGDRHESAAIQFNAPGRGHNVLEVSTSPLSMFYVPLVRTLKERSEDVVGREREVDRTLEDGNIVKEVEIEEVPAEQVLEYYAEGNYKWSSIEVDTRDRAHPVAKIEVVIDGKSAFKLRVEGKPVNLHSATALSTFVPRTFRDVLDKVGLSPGRWF